MRIKTAILFLFIIVFCVLIGWWLIHSLPSGTFVEPSHVQSTSDSDCSRINGRIRDDQTYNGDRVPAKSLKEKSEGTKKTGQVAAKEIPRGVIVGRVVDRFGDPVIPAEIEVRGYDFSRKQQVDSNGIFRVPDLSPGKYIVLVVEDSLPSDYAPPFFQTYTAGFLAKKPDGFMAAEALIPKEGGEVLVKLRVFLRTTVEGHVQDVDGAPLEGVQVRLQNIEAGLQMIAFDAESDEQGFFCMKSVGPGKYVVNTFTGRENKKEYSLSRPIPYDLEIVEGQSLTLPPLVFGKGSLTLIGAVYDQYGKPFPGLDVIVYLKRGVRPNWGDTIACGSTNAKGMYKLGPFPAKSVLVQIAPVGYVPGHDDNLLKHYVEPIALELSGKTGLVRAPDAVAERSEPFEIKGELVSKSGDIPDDIEVEIVHQNGKTEGLKLTREKQEGRCRFQWKVETPHPPVRLQIKNEDSLLYSELLVPRHEIRSGMVFYVP